MPPKFKRKLQKFSAVIKIFLIVLVFTGLIGLIGRPIFWWSVIFSNNLRQTDGLTNLLLLGVSGGTQAGADLTDTMIFLSFNQKTSKTILLSLSRDIWSPTLVAKINTAYHYGEEKGPGGGLGLAKSTVEEVVGLPVHYAIKIDLVGFKEIINLLGGVEVEVERGFDDYKFPIEGKENDLCGGDKEYKCRYQHVHFDAGKQVLNGERAMEYIRSRNAEGDEGTDFARSKRQQKVILALKKRIFSSGFFLHPEKAWQLTKILGKIIETDVPQEDLFFLGRMIIKTNFSEIKTLNLEEWLTNPPTWQYGQWVLAPKTQDFKEIHGFVREQVQAQR